MQNMYRIIFKIIKINFISMQFVFIKKLQEKWILYMQLVVIAELIQKIYQKTFNISSKYLKHLSVHRLNVAKNLRKEHKNWITPTKELHVVMVMKKNVRDVIQNWLKTFADTVWNLCLKYYKKYKSRLCFNNWFLNRRSCPEQLLR